MLKDSLYHITSVDRHENNFEAGLTIDSQHDIFKGHFPGQPVLPGACMLQMLKEVLEFTLDTRLQLKNAANLKFIQVIDPEVNNKLSLNVKDSLDGEELSVNATLQSEQAVCFKCQAVFITT